MKTKFVKLFDSRKGNLVSYVMRDYINKGIATIPLRITDYYEVISPYSVEKYETPDTESIDCVKTCADVMSPECPIVLNLVEDCLSVKEKKTITETIKEYFAYNLGVVEKEEKRRLKRFFIMSIGLILSGILLWISESLDKVSRELLFVLFLVYGGHLVRLYLPHWT